MANKAGGFELGTAWVTLTVDGSNLSKDIQDAMGTAGRDAGRAGEKAGHDFGSKMGTAATKAAKAGAAAIGTSLAAGAGVALSKGFSRLKAIEEAQQKLSGLGNSAQDIASIMDNASKAVEGTAYGLGDAATLAAQMVASDIEPGKELERVLTTVADTSAIAGASLTDMGLIFGSVAAKGKLQGDDMFQLLSRGIPVLQIVGEHIGKTAAEVSDMSSKGQIDFKMFSEAMEEYIGGSAQKMGDTVHGAFANLGAAMGRLGEVWLSPVFQELPGWLTALRDGVNQLKTLSEPGADALAKFVRSLDFDSDSAVQGINEMIDALVGFKNSDFGSAAIDGTVSAVKALYEAGQNLLPILAEFGQIAAKIGGATYLTFVNTTEALAKVLTAMAPAVESVASAIAALPAPVLAGTAAWLKFGDSITETVLPGLKSVAETASASALALKYHNSDLVESSNLYGVAGGQIGAMTQEQYRATEATKKASSAWGSLGKSIKGFALSTGIIAAAGIAVDALVHSLTLDDKHDDWLHYIEHGSEQAEKRVSDLSDTFDRFAAGTKEHSTAVQNFTTDYLDELETKAEETKSIWGATDKWLNEHVFFGDYDDNASVVMQTWAENAEKAVDKLRDVFGDDKSIAELAMGDEASFNDAIENLIDMGDEGYQAALKLMRLRAEIDKAGEGQGGHFHTIANAMKTLADETASASDRVRALDTLLNPEKEPDLNLTLSRASDEVRGLRAEMEQLRGGADVDFMAKFFDDQGNIMTSVQGSTELQEKMADVKNSVLEVVEAGGTSEQAAQILNQSIAEMAEGAGVSFEQMANIITENTGLTQGEIERLVNTIGSTSDTLAEFKNQYEAFNGEPLTISMDVQDPEPELLANLNRVEEGIAWFNEDTGKLEIRVDDEKTAIEVEKVLAQSKATVNASEAMRIVAQIERGEFDGEYNDIRYKVEALEGDKIRIKAEGEGFASTGDALDALRDKGLNIPRNVPVETSINGNEIVVGGLDGIIASQAGIERDVKTQVSAPGAIDSKGQIDQFNRSAGQVPGPKSVPVSAPGAGQAKLDIDAFSFALAALPPFISIPVKAVTSWVGEKLGFGGRAGGGPLPAFAAGGAFDYRLGGTLPRQGDSLLDGILAYSVTGNRPVAMVNGDEFVTNTRSSHLYRKVLELINRDHASVQHLKHLAKGGSVSDTGVSASASVMLDSVYTTAGNNATMRAFHSAVAAFGSTVARYEAAEIEAEKREAARQEKIRKQTELINEQRQRELDNLSERFKDDRKSDAYRNAKKAVDEKFDARLKLIDPPDTRTASEKRRDEERAAARREEETKRAIAQAIAKSGVTGPAADRIYEGVLGINEKSARNFSQTRRMDENVTKAMGTTREQVIEAIRESSTGIAAAIDSAVSNWFGELSGYGKASYSNVLGNSNSFVDRVTGSVAAATDAMVQRMLTGEISAIMPAMLGGETGTHIKRLTTRYGIDSWNRYAEAQRGSARGLEALARTEEGLAEMAQAILTGAATQSNLNEIAKRFGMSDPGLYIGREFIDSAEDYVKTLQDLIVAELNTIPPSKTVVDQLVTSASEWTVGFEEDTMEKLRGDLEKSYLEAREQIARGMLLGDTSSLADDLGAGMQVWVQGINADLERMMADVRKGNRRNSFIEEAPKAYAEHMAMVQRGFTELLETGRVGVDLIAGLQLSSEEIQEWKSWGQEAQGYIAKSMGSRAQDMAREIAEGIEDKTSSEWQKIIDDIAEGFVMGVMTPIDELMSLLGVEAPKALTHDGIMSELKSAANWTNVSREFALAGANAVRQVTAEHVTINIDGAQDPEEVAREVHRVLANPGGYATASMRR